MSKTKQVQVRLTQEEKDGFELAAALAGIPLASWMRERLRLSAIRELESANKKVPFIEGIDIADGKQ